jgi:uncharacterized membrane protein YjdF
MQTVTVYIIQLYRDVLALCGAGMTYVKVVYSWIGRKINGYFSVEFAKILFFLQSYYFPRSLTFPEMSRNSTHPLWSGIPVFLDTIYPPY